MDWRFYYGIARRGCYPKTTAASGCARETNLKFQIGDFRGGKAPDFLCRCKYMISRRLEPFSTFFTPFLSHKGLISRRLRKKQGLFESDAEFHEHKLTQSRRVAESQSRRRLRRAQSRRLHPILRKCCSWIGSVPAHAGREAVDWRIKRSEVGLGGSLSGIKWDYAGRKPAASRLIPDIPAYSRVMRFGNCLTTDKHRWTRMAVLPDRHQMPGQRLVTSSPTRSRGESGR
jgi:hypothetical protein